MDTATLDVRAQRGLAIVKAKGKRIRQIVADKYLVPSQTTNSGGYVVDAAAGTCTCPDHETRGCRCKHLWAVLIVRREVVMPDGSSVVTEHRITYRQHWPAYNAAQMDEKSRVETLLRGLCDGIEQPPAKKTGRHPLRLADVIYGATMKTYVGFSGRRATSDIQSCEARGLVSDAAHYNTIFRYMERPEMTPLLQTLVEQSALPLRAIERQFAIDGTGFSTNTYGRWFDHKYGEEKRAHKYVKAHAVVGTLTNVIATVAMTHGFVSDTPMLPPLIKRATDAGFQIDELSGDKAYLSHENLAAVTAAGAMPFIIFKDNSQGNSKGCAAEAWQRMWHLFSLERDTFLKHYHRRSNVESTFSAVKRLFGTAVRAKGDVAQFNEVYLKCLAYNLTCLVHAIHELGIDPKFWAPTMEVA